MEQFSQFIVNNWQYISIGLICVLEIILFILKKNSKYIIQDDSFYSELSELIFTAERLYSHGPDKLNYVLEKFFERHPYMKDFSEPVVAAIEYLLCLPTKKGGFGREQVKQTKK